MPGGPDKPIDAVGAVCERRRAWPAPASSHARRVEQVVLGEELLLRPGGRVPVDGVVLSGLSSVDEAVSSLLLDS